jgi:transcriptional regulator with XRE-family HTH domain
MANYDASRILVLVRQGLFSMSADIVIFVAMADLPNSIRALRNARGWQQAELAFRVGCSTPQISDLERGNVPLTVEWMRRIAAALQVSPGDLLLPSDNRHQLANWEADIVDRLRAADPATREQAQRVMDALLPFAAQPVLRRLGYDDDQDRAAA